MDFKGLNGAHAFMPEPHNILYLPLKQIPYLVIFPFTKALLYAINVLEIALRIIPFAAA
jgi:hypothetical protein